MLCSTLDFIYVLLFHNYLPLRKDNVVFLTDINTLIQKHALWQVWLKLFQCLWRRCRKDEKFTDKEPKDGERAIRKAHLSCQLR